MKILIACNEEGQWYVRRIKTITHDWDSDEQIYRCDEPLANDLASLEEAFSAAKIILAKGDEHD